MKSPKQKDETMEKDEYEEKRREPLRTLELLFQVYIFIFQDPDSRRSV